MLSPISVNNLFEIFNWSYGLLDTSLSGAMITLMQIRVDQDTIFVHRHVTDQLESSMDAH
jgi:hypothetical protein